MVLKSLDRIPSMELTTVSRLITKGPVWLLSATLAGDGANADAQIYDGKDASGTEKCHLEALSGTTFSAQIYYPVLFHTGIYVAVNASTSHLTLTYVDAEDKTPRRDIWKETELTEGPTA